MVSSSRRTLLLKQCWAVFAKVIATWLASLHRLNVLVTGLLVVVILAAIGALVYMKVAPEDGEGFTEFYILGPDGKAENYPTEVVLGQKLVVIVGIINREYEEVSYRMEVMIDEVVCNDIGPLVLPRDDKWEQEVSFVPNKLGDNQTVQFLLYRQGQDELFRKLQIRIDVKGT